MPIRTVSVISLVYLSRMLGLFMVLPVLVVLGQAYPGATAATLGLALGIYGLTQAVLQIPMGLLSDRLGRKPVILAGLVLFAAGSVLAALADSVTGLIVGRALQGAGAISSSLMALLADQVPIQQRTRAMAVVGISIGLSFSVAMVLGPWVGELAGLAGIFWLTAVLALVSGGLIVSLPGASTGASADASQRWSWREAGQLLRDFDLWRLNLGIFVLHAVLASVFLLVPTRLSGLGYSLLNQGLVYLAMAALALAALGPMMAQSERRGRPKLMLVLAQAFLVLGMGLFWQGGSGAGTLLVAMALFFIGFNFLEASLPSWLSRLAPMQQRGTAMGLFSTGQFLGAATGGALGGAVLNAGGSASVLALVMAMLVLWLVVTLVLPAPPLTRQQILAAPDTGSALSPWAERVQGLPGVIEVQILSAERALKVKVVSREFNEKAAMAALNEQDNR